MFHGLLGDQKGFWGWHVSMPLIRPRMGPPEVLLSRLDTPGQIARCQMESGGMPDVRMECCRKKLRIHWTEKGNVALDVMRSWLNVARLPCAVTSYHTSGSKLRGDKAAVVHEILSRSYCWYFVCLINVIPRTPSEILWTNLHTLKLLDVWLFFLVSLYLRHLLTGMIEPLDTCL